MEHYPVSFKFINFKFMQVLKWILSIIIGDSDNDR